jgi:uncharacterized protein YyaL (SSP411 family)
MAARLAAAGSLYLRQHAAQPVDWHPWDDEALARARAEDRPIFLSIGFATCHWCHVMARESFADEGVAAILNRHFVAIKVDREERPDLDGVYLDALRRLTGRAGWPATLFLTPDLEPFFAGTYFPPEERDGLPGLKRLLEAIAAAWQDRRPTLVANARQVAESLRAPDAADALPEGPALDVAFATLRALWDREAGGLGEDSKFPSAPNLELLLERGRDGDAGARAQLALTLREMARGGIYDLVGGGFHRYSVDRHWRIPHFEKTLPDNALLARCYLAAWKVLGDPDLARIAGETLDYVLGELALPGGGLASGHDAESDGREGAYYVWSFAELERAVGADAARPLGATPDGNWDGVNVLRLVAPVDGAQLAQWRSRLAAARRGRPAPVRDDKAVAAWNATAALALADAGAALGVERYVHAAESVACFVLARLRRADGRLLRSLSQGTASGPAFLDDYAFLGLACLALHQATLSPPWLERALELSDEILRLFAEPDGARLFLTGNDVASPIARPVGSGGLATPSATSAAAELLWRTGRLLGDLERRQRARAALGTLLPAAVERPEEHAHALVVATLMRRPQREIALLGDGDAARALAATVARVHVPEAVFAASPAGDARFALLEGRQPIDGRATAYVCEGMQCLHPVFEPRALAEQLGSAA